MKAVAKNLAGMVMRILSSPFYLLYRVESYLLGKRKALLMVSQSVSLFPGLSGEWFRRSFMQWVTGLRLKDCCISFGTTFSDPRIKIGDGVYLGRGCDVGYADIGRNCIVGSGVHILSGLEQHGFENLDIPTKDQAGEFKRIIIGEDTWIGNASVIAADIGKKCVIGAGSVVVSSIPDFSIAVGNPAKEVNSRKTPIDSD